MQKPIVVDTSCLILLTNINMLDLLEKLFREVYITEEVRDEFNKPLPEWIKIKNPENNISDSISKELDIGEATVISLALDNNESLLIIDELKGRIISKKLGVKITGTLGILLTAKKKGLIKSVKPIIQKIQKTDFRMSDLLIEKILKIADEM